MYGNYFTYNGASSQDYGLVIGGFRTDPEVPLAMSRDILKGSMNRYRIIPNHMGTSYQDVLVFTVSMVKDPCFSDEYVFTEADVDEIVSWLTAPKYPTLFHMYDEEPDVYKKYDYYGLFSDIQTMTNNEDVIGFTATFTTNSPYAWDKEKTAEYNSDSTDMNTMIITVNSSEHNSPIWPVITIYPSIDAETTTKGRVPITIRNEEDGKEMVVNVLKGSPTIIDCKRCMISGPSGLLHFNDLGLTDVGSMYWFRLYNGNNAVSISAQANITFTYQEPKKVGAY